MIGRYIPTFLRHAPVPGVQGFALLAGIEASVRGILVSVWPLVIYQALGDAGRVSQLYFYAGILSFSYGMLLPWFGRFVARCVERQPDRRFPDAVTALESLARYG